jgi:hypothetical protein
MSEMYQGERRSYQCECGSQMYYQEDGKKYCAMPKCHKIVSEILRRGEDKEIPTYHALKDVFNGK